MNCKPLHKYLCKKDIPDARDFKPHKFHLVAPFNLPPAVDLRQKIQVPIYNQGDLGSCTANAIGFAHQYQQKFQKENDFIPSRLFIYYLERKLEGTVGEDSGAQIRDGFKVLRQFGVCPETMWPYDVCNFTTEPTQDCYDAAAKCESLNYFSLLNSTTMLKQCLAAGFPFVCGIDVYESFESREVGATGVIPMPGDGEECLGGHAVAFVGYDDVSQTFILRNSWGEDWGQAGYGLLPYAYLPSYGSDFWTLRLVE
jgi:C1A family cysteine protease